MHGRDVAATVLDELAERVARLERVVEQIAGAPVPQILESFVDGAQVPKERVQNRVGEQIGAVPVLQIWEPIGEGVQLAPQERVLNRTQEQIVVDNVHRITEDDVEVVCVAPRERVQNHTPEQIVDVPLPRSDPGGRCGRCTCCTTGVRGGSYSGAARG